MSGNNPVTFKSTPAPKHAIIRIARGKIVKKGGMFGEGVDPNLEGALSEMKRRGVKVIGWDVDEASDEYRIKTMIARPGADGLTEGDKPMVFVPESFGGGGR